MNKIKCKECGYETLYMGTECRNEQCEICGGEMYLKKENERAIIEGLANIDKNNDIIDHIGTHDLPKKDYYTIEEVLEMDLIRSMEDNIKSVGHKRTWECIEKLVNPLQRIVFRRGFFNAGGRIT